MRYLGLAIAIAFLAATVTVAIAGPLKVGETRDTIYACTTVEALNRVLSAKSEDSFNAEATAGVAEGKCILAPGDTKFELTVTQPLDVYHPTWAPMVFRSFQTVLGATYYTFVHEVVQGV